MIRNSKELEEFDDELVFTTYFNPLPRRVLPISMSTKDGRYTTEAVNLGRRFMETKGIIVNSDAELESHAVKCLMNDFDCVPPVYTVGPLIDLKGESNKLHGMGSFGEEQVKEIAFGLEQCGARSLWSIRKPAAKDKLAESSDYTSDHLQEILPNGFLERTKEMGMPLYTEQKINAFKMVKDLGLAVELRLDYTNNSKEVVLGDEIARAIKCVMESDNLVRKKVKEKSEKSGLSVTDGGSSFAAYGKLIEGLLVNM
ncbi:UDP-glycosyltransferase 71K1-like [Pistacia vera]|uniref:UDP-glycosyltransferase 71K1-like n=1 Tax=Pistacia vera TaxID=55513 RepID=UPI0012634B78|nr:UDP-glycosyltransferase 71K1-like [Pistacia vera]